jgi:hypothetical protein
LQSSLQKSFQFIFLFFYNFTNIKKNECHKFKPATQSAIYSATPFLKKWFCKLSTTFLEPEKKSEFAEPLFSNLEKNLSLQYHFSKKWLQIKWISALLQSIKNNTWTITCFVDERIDPLPP